MTGGMIVEYRAQTWIRSDIVNNLDKPAWFPTRYPKGRSRASRVMNFIPCLIKKRMD